MQVVVRHSLFLSCLYINEFIKDRQFDATHGQELLKDIHMKDLLQ